MSGSFKNKNTVLGAVINNSDDALKTNSIITDANGNITTTTNNSGKVSLDVNVTDITLTAATDSVSTVTLQESIRVDFSSSTAYVYKGFATVGSSDGAAMWKICKISLLDADAGSTRWADGNLLYDNVWDNRASYTYS